MSMLDGTQQIILNAFIPANREYEQKSYMNILTVLRIIQQKNSRSKVNLQFSADSINHYRKINDLHS